MQDMHCTLYISYKDIYYRNCVWSYVIGYNNFEYGEANCASTMDPGWFWKIKLKWRSLRYIRLISSKRVEFGLMLLLSSDKKPYICSPKYNYIGQVMVLKISVQDHPYFKHVHVSIRSRIRACLAIDHHYEVIYAIFRSTIIFNFGWLRNAKLKLLISYIY